MKQKNWRMASICHAVWMALSGAASCAIAEESSAVVTLGEVNVSAGGLGGLALKNVLTSVNVLGGDRIQAENVMNPYQIFAQLPGVMLTEFRQGTTSGKFSMRGFNGEGTVNAVKLLIDGIPGNSNDGNMPYLDLLMPLEIEAVELVKGTNDPRYGLHNIAGNANLVTTVGGNTTQARVRVGSFNTREVQLAKGKESDGFSQNYFIGHQVTDTYREHGDSERLALAGKWFFTPDSETRFGVIARASQQEADEPGYLRQAVAEVDPRSSGSHAATDQGRRKLLQVSAHYDQQLNNALFWSSKAYVNRIDDQRWVRFSDDTAINRQQERLTDETHLGVMSNLTWRASERVALEGGVNAEWQQNESHRYRTQERVRLGQTRDQQFDFDNVGGYVQATIKATDRLRVIPAYRLDKFTGELRVENLTGSFTNGSYTEYAMYDYGWIKQPKISAIYDLTEQFSLYGNWGRAFQVGLGAGSYRSASQTTDLRPSINDGWETGVKWKGGAGIEGRLAVWNQTASNEFGRKLNDPANSSENVGETERKGVDLEARFKLTEKLGLWGAYSWQKAKIIKADAANSATEGQELDHVPHHLWSLGVDYQHNDALKFSLWSNGQSDYYVDRQNLKGKFGDYRLWHFSASYQVSPAVALQLQVKNLTNQSYEYVWYDTSVSPNTQHGAGDGRAIYGAVHIRY